MGSSMGVKCNNKKFIGLPAIYRFILFVCACFIMGELLIKFSAWKFIQEP